MFTCRKTVGAIMCNMASEAPRAARSGRRTRRFSGMAVATLFIAMLQSGARAFEYGEPIEVFVSSDDSLTLTFEGDPADAVAVSFQQCSGAGYMSMEITYDGESLRDTSSVTSSTCHRVIGSGASLDDASLEFDNICAFKNSGTVGLGYDEESTSLTSNNASTINGTADSASYSSVDPSYLTVTLTNSGSISATAQFVMFSTTLSATNAGASIDRVHTEHDQLENTFTVDAEFQASGTGEENFCIDELGCAVYAYYLDMDELEDDLFGTSCQAREGIKVYEGYTAGDDVNSDETTTTITTTTTTDAAAAVTQSTTAFEFEACVELPKNTAGTYRVYIIVSPDTSTYARVGYGLQDQLIYASSAIVIEDDMDETCPEIEIEETSGALRINITPLKASGMMAATLTAAAARGGF